MDENIAYDQLPVMSPMMASNSNESGNGGQSMIDDGKLSIKLSKIIFYVNSISRKFSWKWFDGKILHDMLFVYIQIILQNVTSAANLWMPLWAL